MTVAQNSSRHMKGWFFPEESTPEYSGSFVYASLLHRARLGRYLISIEDLRNSYGSFRARCLASLFSLKLRMYFSTGYIEETSTRAFELYGAYAFHLPFAYRFISSAS